MQLLLMQNVSEKGGGGGAAMFVFAGQTQAASYFCIKVGVISGDYWESRLDDRYG